jgi:hypothetical protein
MKMQVMQVVLHGEPRSGSDGTEAACSWPIGVLRLSYSNLVVSFWRFGFQFFLLKPLTAKENLLSTLETLRAKKSCPR